MQNIKIEIPKPCSEDWDKMKIGLNKRFCENCQKNVMDFTQKSRVEILSYLLMNKGKETCGRINKSQLDFYHEDIFVTIQALNKSEKSSNLPFYILTLGSLILAGCNTTESHQPIPTKPVTQIDSTIKTDVSDSTKKDSTECTKKTTEPIIRPVTGLIETGEMITMGVPEIIQEDYNTLGKIALPDSGLIYEIVDTMPEFIGGIDELQSYMSGNLIYPAYERENRIEGTVYVSFVVEKDGKISDPKILKSVQGSKTFDAEVLRVINNMPNWKPGKMYGKEVAVKFNLPVKFDLQKLIDTY